jgi:hypothetical protein
MPTVVGTGAVASSLNAITPAFPASIAANDILITIAECEGVTTPGAYTLPSGWAHVTGSPVQEGTNTRLWVIWRRYDGVFTAPSLGDSGDHNQGRMIAIRGCPTVGNPWDVTSFATDPASNTSASWPTATTTAINDLVLLIASTSADIGTAQISAITNAALTSTAEQIDNATTSGNGGVIICWTGIKATVGAIGATTATLTTAATKSFMTLAMKDDVTQPRAEYRTAQLNVYRM